MTLARLMAGLIFFAGGTFAAGFVFSLWYEAYAVWTTKDPTISQITALQIASHPAVAGFFIFASGVLLGALVTHFTNWRP